MKNILQDVVPPTKRSIRDIPISDARKKTTSFSKEEGGGLKGFPGSVQGVKSTGEGGSKWKWWLVIVAALVIIFVALSTVFAGVTISLVPKQESVDFNVNLHAIRNDIKTSETGVPFDIISVSDEKSEVATNVEEKEVDKKASGKIVVFNDYNSSPQKLVINTRFETPDGLIYRIPKSIVVPGQKKEDGKIIPGSIEVTVYADAPGEKYNIGLSDFTIPGFKGSPRFSKFYARSKTTMTGGFSGAMKIVPESDLENIKSRLQESITASLKESVASKIPEDYVLYGDGEFVSFESQPNVDLGDSVQIVEKGVLKAIIFDKKLLSDYVAQNVLADLEGGSVEIVNIEDLDFNLGNKNSINLDEDLGFDFSLGGATTFAWTFDEAKMKSDFAGQPKKNINTVLSGYVGIEEAEVTISPFWKMSFPNDINKIKIERVLNLN